MQINAVHQPHLDPFVGLLHNLFVVWPRAITGETAIWRLLMLAKYSANIKFKGRPTEFDSDLVELKETAVRQQSAQILFLRNCAPLHCYYHHSKFTGQGRKAPAFHIKNHQQEGLLAKSFGGPLNATPFVIGTGHIYRGL